MLLRKRGQGRTEAKHGVHAIRTCSLLRWLVEVTLADEAPGIGVHQLFQLLKVERRLEQLHDGAFARKERSMRTEDQSLHRYRTAVTRIRSLDESPDAAVPFGGGNIEADSRFTNQCRNIVAEQRARPR